MIHEFNQQQYDRWLAKNPGEPKQVWYDLGRIVVYTGDDIPRQSAQEQIDQIESSVTPRMLREAALGIDKKRLAEVDAQIKELRRKL